MHHDPMKDSLFYKILAAVILVCVLVTLLLVIHTVELRSSVSILSYIATEGL
jgi:hypothetical protein